MAVLARRRMQKWHNLRGMPETPLSALDMRRTLGRMAHQVLENNRGSGALVVVGIMKHGLPFARRLAFAMTQIEGTTIPCGGLDIRRFRDDIESQEQVPDESEVPFGITGKTVVLADEVIHTGRTIRAAMDALMRHGRPGSIQLAVLIDRGGRELPIQPNYVGMKMEVGNDERVIVKFSEVDGEDSVFVVKGTVPCG
jgi:pyrimidine operon attenuation protein/uracil phosphoribosyltransferase